MLKTTTLLDDKDQPIITLCPGHVSALEFNEAIEREGKTPAHTYAPSELSFEFFLEGPEGHFISCRKNAVGAKPFTVLDW